MSFPYFTVDAGHELAYNEIVKPHRRWAFSYYFLYRWLPLLHPQQAMLIQLLRQATWRDGKPTGRCQLSNGVLCQMMGWSESSHKSLLCELERDYSDWFIQRERTRKRHVTQGHAVEGAPRYRIQMDEPLTPRDQQALLALMAQQQPRTPYQAAEWLISLSQQPTRALWALLDEQPIDDSPLPDRSTTVAALTRQSWPHLYDAPPEAQRTLLEAAERLQLRVTGAGYAHMELDYLRRAWLPQLGINQTWLAIVLRARCFHDPNSSETRDVVTVSRKTLEAQLTIPARTFRRLLRDESLIPLFLTSAVGESADPQDPRAMPHRGNVAFTVAYPLLPIAPKDQTTYAARLFAAHTVPSTKGQPTPLNVASRPDSSTEPLHKGPTDPAERGQATPLIHNGAASRPISIWPPHPAEPWPTSQSAPLNAANQPDIPLTITHQEPLFFQESKEPTTLGGRGEVTKSDQEKEICALLEPFGINNLRPILENRTLTIKEVRGWIARGYDEVAAPQMAGYLFRRLRRGSDIAQDDPLPHSYQLLGEIDREEAALFERWWLEERPIPVEPSPQTERYGVWLRVIKGEAGDPHQPDYSPHARWRRTVARQQRQGGGGVGEWYV
ncbi:MAG: hypothetical protein KDD73_04845 [Anaerolineales bacterium]|nr:hypothetical protein [Anaerolineales bacterium]